jgi:small subunit ribosomal protein S29
MDFRHANEQILSEFDVNMTHYGKYDISGIRDGEPEPNPKVWDPLRKVWSDSWKDNLFENEIIDQNAQNEKLNYRLSDKLRDPKKLIEIVDEGIRNPEVSISAFGEVLEQLYRSDKHQTMISLDGFNTFFQPSQYPSFRYENNKHYKGCIPPYDLAIARLLMKFDGHFMRNGVKVAATSHYRFFNHTMKPSDIKFPEGYHQQVSNLKLNDFRNAMKYYEVSGFWQNRYQREYQVESFFMET